MGAFAMLVLPRDVSVHVNGWLLPASPGTVALKTANCRLTAKCVGWPQSMGAGLHALFGPIGISTSSSQFRFKYPNTMLTPPLGVRIQPSYTGATSCPLAC